ncbi:MAG TPA: GPP34 family phosphoprotein [Solirubrobacter sp.]|nr:GPP34 family phosphoprotein [Solirubrobacter sp.]
MLLSHALLLLILDEEKGTPRSMAGREAGLAGAILLDLLAAGALAERDGKLVAVGSPPGELEEAWSALADEPRSAKQALRRLKPQTGTLPAALVAAGVLEERHLRFGRVRYPEADPGPELAVRERLRTVLAGAEPDAWTASLLGLLVPLRLVKPLFGRDAERRAKAIAEQGPVGDAVQAAVQQQISAAVIAATVAATTAATSG